MKPRILLFVLCSAERSGWISPYLCQSLLVLRQDPRFDLTVSMVVDQRPLYHARNLCIVAARAREAHLACMIDNDMTLPSNFADILLEAFTTSKAVVSLACGILHPEGSQIIPSDNGQADGDFRETGCVGGGVLIISSEVWRAIPRGPWFRWDSNEDEVLSTRLSEDFYFVELVLSHGLKVWTHKCVAGHLKTSNATRWILELKRLEDELTRQRGGILPLEVLNPPVFVEK